MDEQNDFRFTKRENFLMGLLDRITKEYKILLDITRRRKLFKIVDILELSKVPGETKFAIQVANKVTILELSAAEIINNKYNLNDFNSFHAEMIRQAALGKLTDFLNLSDSEPLYQITSKKYDREKKQYIFTIISKDQDEFVRTAEELSWDKQLLSGMNVGDIYDVGHTQGSESILKEKTAILLAKKSIT